MAQIIIDIPDNEVNRVLTAVCAVKGYDTNSGLTRAQFSKQHIASYVKDIVRRYEREQAKQTAFDSINDIDAS